MTDHELQLKAVALGQGLPICVGMALAGKMDAAPRRIFTLLGDGRLAEGSNSDAAMAAAAVVNFGSHAS